MVEKFGGSESDLSELRVISMILIGYAGFLRFSELINIKRSDLKFFET